MPPDSEVEYKCLCPDGMKAVQEAGVTKCRCPDGQVTQQNGTCQVEDGGVTMTMTVVTAVMK